MERLRAQKQIYVSVSARWLHVRFVSGSEQPLMTPVAAAFQRGLTQSLTPLPGRAAKQAHFVSLAPINGAIKLLMAKKDRWWGRRAAPRPHRGLRDQLVDAPTRLTAFPLSPQLRQASLTGTRGLFLTCCPADRSTADSALAQRCGLFA